MTLNALPFIIKLNRVINKNHYLDTEYETALTWKY